MAETELDPTLTEEPPPAVDEKRLKKYEQQLAEYGLKVNNKGKIVGGEAGVEKKPEVLALLQQGWNLFGLTNDNYDPQRAFFDRGVGELVSLGTGVYSSGVVSDARLAHLQAIAGWDPAYAQEFAATQFAEQSGSDYVPAAFRTPESYSAYLAAARGNYMETYNAETPQTNAPPDLALMDDEGLFAFGETVNQLVQSRKQRASARSFMSDFFDFSDFGGEE